MELVSCWSNAINYTRKESSHICALHLIVIYNVGRPANYHIRLRAMRHWSSITLILFDPTLRLRKLFQNELGCDRWNCWLCEPHGMRLFGVVRWHRPVSGQYLSFNVQPTHHPVRHWQRHPVLWVTGSASHQDCRWNAPVGPYVQQHCRTWTGVRTRYYIWYRPL